MFNKLKKIQKKVNIKVERTFGVYKIQNFTLPADLSTEECPV